jgi:hypothetical protein
MLNVREHADVYDGSEIVFIFLNAVYTTKQTEIEQVNKLFWSNTGLFKKKYTLSKIYFTKTTDAKSMSYVRMERKSLKVLISMV